MSISNYQTAHFNDPNLETSQYIQQSLQTSPYVHPPQYYQQINYNLNNTQPLQQSQQQQQVLLQSQQQFQQPIQQSQQSITKAPINQHIYYQQPTQIHQTAPQLQQSIIQSPVKQSSIYLQQQQQQPQQQLIYRPSQSPQKIIQQQPQQSLIQTLPRPYNYPTISHNLTGLSTTEKYEPQPYKSDYKPLSAQKYDQYNYDQDDYFSSTKLKQREFPSHQPNEIPTATMLRGDHMVSPLEDKFSAYKDNLRSNTYSYMQMIDNVCLCFKEQIMCEREVEALKRQLWEKIEFDPSKVFKLFSQDQKFVSQQDFIESVQATLQLPDSKISDIQLLFQRYGRAYSDSEKMTLEEFKHFFYIDNFSAVRTAESKEDLQQSTVNLISRFFKMLLNCESSMEYTRQKLKKKLVNYTYVFDYIDRKHRGLITESDIRCLIENTGTQEFFVNQRDAEKIIARFDRNEDKVIDLTEFVQQFQPKSKAIYIEDEY